MRRTLPLALVSALGLLAGCGKKPPPPAAEAEKGAKAEPAADPAAERNKQLNLLKTGRGDARRNAMEELAWLADEDPAVVPALVELLRDKSTAGSGNTRANQVNSTREAAAVALLACTNGEQVMREKGLPVLRAGLTDPSAAVREHTAYTIGRLGAVGQPLAADVQKLCTDADESVRGAAFDALRATGVGDPVAFVKLLKHDNQEVVRLTAQLIPHLSDVPSDAVGPLTEALASEDTNIRAAAAEGLAVAGPKAAPAAQQLADTVRKSYPDKYDPKDKDVKRHEGPEASYWRALARIGPAAVEPVAKLLDHPNAEVRQYAARTLGEIGPASKSAVAQLKKALADNESINVVVEAAIVLCALGEETDAALAKMKEGLEYPMGEVAAAVVVGIPRMGEAGRQLVPLALAKLGDANKHTRLAAVTLVGELPVAEASKAAADVGKQAADPEAEIRRRVGQVLEHLGPAGAAAADALGNALANEKDAHVRSQFVEALIAMGPGAKPAVPALLPLPADKELSVALRVRVTAAVAVADPSSAAVSETLVKAAADGEPLVRAAAAEAMGKLNPLPPGALAALVKLAKSDRDYGARMSAVRGLTAAGPRAKSAKGDVDSLTTNPHPGLALWAKVAAAALDGDVSRSAAAVRAGLSDRNAQVRAAAAQTLLVIGPTAADLPALIKVMKDALPAAKAAAAAGAGRLGAGAKDAVPQLQKLLDDEKAEVQVAAADALGAIGPDAKPAVGKLKEATGKLLVRAAAQRALDRIEAK